MNNETPAALTYAGPDSWHHLIAPTHTFPLTEATIQAAALTGINYQTIHDAARKGRIYWGRYDVVPTFRVSRRDTIKWAKEQSC